MPKQSAIILHVDDEPPIREVVTTLIDMCGFEFKEAGDPVEALAMMKETDFDVILSDFMMPKMSGLEFLKEVREAGFTKPFLFLSAFSGSDNRVQAEALGAYAFIDKPFNSKALSDMITEAVSASKVL